VTAPTSRATAPGGCVEAWSWIVPSAAFRRGRGSRPGLRQGLDAGPESGSVHRRVSEVNAKATVSEASRDLTRCCRLTAGDGRT